MTTITEDYVSFETVKLLKEKDFDISCRPNYRSTYQIYKVPPFYHNTPKDFNGKEYERLNSEWSSTLTLQLVMKWLREVHNKHIQVGYDIQLSWYYDIIDLKETVSYDYEEMKCWHNEFNFNNYEETVEAAINYCLENLI